MQATLRSSRLLSLVVLWLVVSKASVADAQAFLEVPHGFASTNRFQFDAHAAPEKQISALTFLPNGDPVVYVDGKIRIHRHSGVDVIATFEPALFGSFTVVAPDGASLFFGENSTGQIFSVPFDGTGQKLVDRINFNFDLAIAPETAGDVAGFVFVSGLGPNGSNSIWLLDDDPETSNDEIIANLPRFSGPVAFDSEGHLYYMTSGAQAGDFADAPHEEGERLVRFTPEQLASGLGTGARSFSVGQVILGGQDSLYNLVSYNGKLYGTNLGFATGIGTINVIDLEDDFGTSVFASVRIGERSGSPSLLALYPGAQPFEAGRGEYGGRMLVAYGNYSDISNVAEIIPELFFRRGFLNDDDSVNIADASFLLSYLFNGGDHPQVLEAADINDDGRTDLSDALFLLRHLFRDGPQPPEPFKRVGEDPTP